MHTILQFLGDCWFPLLITLAACLTLHRIGWIEGHRHGLRQADRDLARALRRHRAASKILKL